MRREGIYSSYLTTWRRQREAGELDGLAPQKRGPKPNPQAIELAKLRRENERLQERLRAGRINYQRPKKSRADVWRDARDARPGRSELITSVEQLAESVRSVESLPGAGCSAKQSLQEATSDGTPGAS